MKELLQYCLTLPEVEFEPGDEVLSEGSKTGIIYILKEGKAEVVKRNVQVTVVDEPGAVFGEISVFLGIPHMATVRCVTRSRFFRVDDPAGFLQSNTAICYHVAHLLAQRVNSVTNYLADIKEQYKDSEGHFGMIDEILDTLVHQQGEEPTPGSDRDPV